MDDGNYYKLMWIINVHTSLMYSLIPSVRESTDGGTEGGTGVAQRWRTEPTRVFLWIGQLLNITCSVLNEQVSG